MFYSQKLEVAIKIQALALMIERQFKKWVKIFRTDNAKDFCN